MIRGALFALSLSLITSFAVAQDAATRATTGATPPATTGATTAAKRSIPPAGDAAAAAVTASPRHGEYVEVPLGNATIRSWVVYPERKDKAPVVIVIHEIFGLSDWVRGVTDQLAADGFIAIAPDLLSGKGPNGGGTESFQGDAVRSAIRKLTPEETNARLDAVRAYATTKMPAAAPKVATVGFCWGGSASFNYAVHQPGLNAAVVYYGGGPAQKEKIEQIAAPVLALYAEDDNRVNATIEASESAMKAANKPFTKHVYDGAGHGFLRQQSGKEGANRKASEQAWPETIAFLKKHLE